MLFVLIVSTFTFHVASWGMLTMLTLMLTSFSKLAMFFCFCKCPPFLWYILVLSLLSFGVGFELNLTSLIWVFWCSICVSSFYFLGSLKPFKMKSGRFFIYPSTELFKIRWMSQHGSFSSYCHIGVCAILTEVVQVNKRFLPILGGLWWVIGLLFKRNLLVFHVLRVATTLWTIIWPLIFVDVWLWVEPESIITLLELFNPWC